MRRLHASGARMSKKRSVDLRAKKLRSFLFDKRAVSVALTTLIISAGVVAAGIAVLYWARSWGNMANDQYASSVANSQNSILEGLSFEFITYSSSKLTVYVISCGLSNNMTLARLYIWNNVNQPIGTYNIFQLYRTSDGANISSLNKGDEGYFQVAPSPALSSGYYTIRVVTGSGRNFDGSLSV